MGSFYYGQSGPTRPLRAFTRNAIPTFIDNSQILINPKRDAIRIGILTLQQE